jgi:hypothetical protein
MNKLIIASILSAVAQSKPFCTENGINWTKFNGRAKKIATNPKTDTIWIVTTFKHRNSGFNLARIDTKSDRTFWDFSAEQGAKPWIGSSLAVDPYGNPAFVDEKRQLHWKRGDKWSRPMKSCVYTAAFGGDGILYARDCRFNYIHQR